MTTIETVSIEDVYPLEDEYGNQYLSRDYSTKENKAYVKELARSMAAKGVPDEPVVLVRDGGIYRIKAGNSRVMAMRELGTKRFEAVIDEDDTPQSLVEAAIRTNTKKKYEAVEESRFVQQLALLAPDEYVGDVAGMEPAKVARIRKARAVVDDAAEDMSLLRLIAIGEFADDPEAVKELANCTEKEFERIADRLRRNREVAEKRSEMEAALAARGIEVTDCVPAGLSYILPVCSPEDIPDDLPCDAVARSSYGCQYGIYGTIAEEVDPEEEARRAELDARKALWDATSDAREAWLAGHVEEPMPALWELTDESPYNYAVDRFVEEHGISLPKGPADAINALFEDNERPIDRWSGELRTDRCRSFLAFADILRGLGYEPPQEEEELCRIVKEHLESEGDDQ